MLLPYSGGVDALLLLVIALVVDACIGDSAWLRRFLPGPADLVARAMVRYDRRLNRIDRSDAVRRARGSLVTLLLLVLGGLVGFCLSVLVRHIPAGGFVELLVLVRCLTLRLPWGAMGRTVAALETRELETARQAVGPLTDRQLWSLDDHGVVRAGMEGAARALTHGVVAPALFYTLFGLAGLLAWAALDGTVRVIGHDTPRHAQFGALARRLSSLLGLPAALIATLVVLLSASFVPRASALRGLRDVKAARGHPMGADAMPVAAFAGVLDLSVAGPRREGERVVKEPWLGSGRARALPRDLRAAMALYAISALIAAGLVVVSGLAAAY
ncbi:cobalamin biosynthesis protein [Niveispirillum sp.]|uniref:cobalamin biosynthesis protein CobD/CbiB n=1 Tax=Niveispirillum sp. TaxID=1917217 RepID=UPI001B526815|nr:cobalamin biosynthesis protein [Niveispirillum sp.]MBP7340020.1 cobalamin biosynthesis protein [Niveispirillum sp.]